MGYHNSRSIGIHVVLKRLYLLSAVRNALSLDTLDALLQVRLNVPVLSDKDAIDATIRWYNQKNRMLNRKKEIRPRAKRHRPKRVALKAGAERGADNFFDTLVWKAREARYVAHAYCFQPCFFFMSRKLFLLSHELSEKMEKEERGGPDCESDVDMGQGGGEGEEPVAVQEPAGGEPAGGVAVGAGVEASQGVNGRQKRVVKLRMNSRGEALVGFLAATRQ